MLECGLVTTFTYIPRIPTACMCTCTYELRALYIRAKGLGQSADQHCTGWRNVCVDLRGAFRKSPASGCGKSSQNLEPESIVAVNGTGVAP